MKNIVEYLESTYKKYPNKVAFVDDIKSYTFLEVRTIALKIATAISKVESIARRPIVVFMDKSSDSICVFLGVVYSGNFYCPIDISAPASRIKKIIDTLNSQLYIVEKKHIETVQDLGVPLQQILIYEECICEIEETKILENIDSNLIDTDPLYVLFTSGSTGTPKGVVICHRSVIDYTEWVTNTFDITQETCFGNQAPFYFDNSILDIYCTIKNGATMYIIPSKLFKFPVELLNYINEKKINTIFWVPSALVIVANLKALNSVSLPNLNKVLFCGEVMPNKQLNVWRKHLPTAVFANLYGPTEITDACSYYIVNRAFEDNQPLPIGIPCKNTDIIVLNENNDLVEQDEVGELCVRGSSLAHGYYSNPEKTKEAFVQNPLNPYYPELIYRTGDLVRYNEYGELMYVSRKDYQIKHMGNRIELGEIETVANALEGIEISACIYDEKHMKIILYFTGETPVALIREFLKANLPEYMIPHVIKRIGVMPLNANGKIDRGKLLNGGE